MTAASSQQRETLVFAALAGGELSPPEVALLAGTATALGVKAGEVITSEGQRGACYVLASGRAALTQLLNGTPHMVGTAEPGDLIGCEGFASAERKQSVTATATSDVDLLELDRSSFQGVMDASQALRKLIADRAEHLLVERLIRATASFDGVSSKQLDVLLRTVHRIIAPAGTQIIKQGDAGTEAYVIVDGQVEVIDEGTQRTLATLGNGALFGEASLLSDVTRSATVRATQETILLTLSREPLLDILQKNASTRARMLDLLNSRARPAQRPGIEVHRRTSADGSVTAILKDPAHHKYFRLSGDSLFLWERCDGTHTIRDLAMALFQERQHFALQEIIAMIGHLRSAGFLGANASFQGAEQRSKPTSRFDPLFAAAKTILTATLHFDAVDPLFAALYRVIGRPLFSWPSAIVLALASLLGIVLFVLTASKAFSLLTTSYGIASFFVFLFPAYALLILLHESSHGLAVKAIGRTVSGLGIGWYWFGPIAFIDTSDSWLGTRAQRVLVSAAGPAANLVLGAVASGVAFWATSPIVMVVAWQFALTAYIGFIENMNPLLEYDGYYVLIDLLERPNLRRQSLQWIGSHLPQLYRQPRLARGHIIECSYAAGAVFYIFFAVAQSSIVYHFYGQQQLARIFPSGVVSLLAWVLPVALTVMAFAALASEVRRVTDAALG